MNSALGFAQGLYPPVWPTLRERTLRKGTVIEALLNNTQRLPTYLDCNGWQRERHQSGKHSLSANTNGCTKVITSSNEYLTIPEYLSLLASTKGFYKSLEPLINSAFNASQASFANACTST